ncbi:hypothetical protein CC1G_08312 [Coprinopsis cinerea okayama7|uniref:Uncharacterized protein n=1 Tax=Coprinopsis cinerea (strain Okayama-7 / 130 / ATCC MYA-4618 / FGSC 9003) TaxID=240176 RepID=A8PG83_COPC7|nr:hypothetical protein CC1G_08312 [Coprinopsis cinerea okayama7\|eukprot:XP_001841168.1 hypothetical protein CC1G_08312 [Coprinopsis cinerea okayama7\
MSSLHRTQSPLFRALCLLALAVQATSVDVWLYPNRDACDGGSLGWRDIVHLDCYADYPPTHGYSVEFRNLPPGAQGIVQTGGECLTPTGGIVYGPGDHCWNTGIGRGKEPASGVYWWDGVTYPTASQSRREEGVKCSGPTHFRYTDPHGVEHTIRIPTGVKPEDVVQQYENQEWGILSAYESARTLGLRSLC